jgi:hypothetical protein
MTMVGAQALAELIRTSIPSLKRLTFSGGQNEDDDDDVHALTMTTTMTKVDWPDRHLQDHDVVILTAFLSSTRARGGSHSVTSIDLSVNRIGPKGALALTRGMSSCSQLTKLNMSYNRLTRKGGDYMALALARTSSMREISVTGRYLPITHSSSGSGSGSGLKSSPEAHQAAIPSPQPPPAPLAVDDSVVASGSPTDEVEEAIFEYLHDPGAYRYHAGGSLGDDDGDGGSGTASGGGVLSMALKNNKKPFDHRGFMRRWREAGGCGGSGSKSSTTPRDACEHELFDAIQSQFLTQQCDGGSGSGSGSSADSGGNWSTKYQSYVLPCLFKQPLFNSRTDSSDTTTTTTTTTTTATTTSSSSSSSSSSCSSFRSLQRFVSRTLLPQVNRQSQDIHAHILKHERGGPALASGTLSTDLGIGTLTPRAQPGGRNGHGGHDGHDPDHPYDGGPIDRQDHSVVNALNLSKHRRVDAGHRNHGQVDSDFDMHVYARSLVILAEAINDDFQDAAKKLFANVRVVATGYTAAVELL